MQTMLIGIVVLSGFAALVFESMWFHQAGLGLGNGVWASSIVLAGFMAGIGLGNLAMARFGDRLRQPLKAYAALELVIAISGVVVVHLLPPAGPFAADLLGSDVHPVVLNLVRLGLSFALLAVPSAAMGMTLPVLTRALSAGEDNRFGSVLGILYGANTFGAVLGALASELYLVEALGIRGTALVAGAADLAAAGLALALVSRFPTVEPQKAPQLRNVSAAWPWMVAAFATGFAILALEVIWFRFLVLYVMSTPAAFSLMLAVVLLGIAAGGALGGRWLDRSEDASDYAGVVALGTSLFGVLGYLLAPLALLALDNGRVSSTTQILWLAVPLMFPVCLGSGVLFPLLGASLRRRLGTDAASVGLLTLANTSGAAIGSIVGGFFLLPMLGIETSLFVLVGLLFLIGVGLTFLHTAARPLGAAAGVGAFVALLGFPHGAIDSHLRARADWYDAELVGLREGLTETIVYVAHAFYGQVTGFRMVTNYHSMAGTDWSARRYMKVYTWLPVALKPDTSSALLISYGCGQTAKSLTDTASLTTIHVADISRDVLDMNAVVFPKGEIPHEDPRVTVHIDDGRWVLQNLDQSFDLITSEPPPPENAGTVSLYTQEYFQLLHDRLNEGGMVTYWLPIHGLSDVSSKAILTSFCNVFDDCTLWSAYRSNLMMVGTRGATGGVSAEDFAAQWRDPVVGPELRGAGFDRPEQLGALFLGGPDWIREIVGSAEPLVDDRPHVLYAGFSESDPSLLKNYPAWKGDLATRPEEYLSYPITAPNPFYEVLINSDAAAEARFRSSPWIKRMWPADLLEPTVAEFPLQRALEDRFHRREVPDAAIERAILDRTSRNGTILLLGSDVDHQRAVDALNGDTLRQPDVRYHLGVRALVDHQFALAASHFEAAKNVPDRKEDAPRFAALARKLSLSVVPEPAAP